MNAYNGVIEFLAPRLPDFGYAVDVGANDGTNLSNSICLDGRGWIVLCVEPNPALAAEGRSKRKLWRQVALGATCGEVDFHVFGDYPHEHWSGVELRFGGPISETSWEEVKAKSSLIKVEMLTLDVLLHQSGFPRLDVLFVDVEGYEEEVLKGFSTVKWQPTYIVLEAWNLQREEILTRLMAVQGYKFLAKFEFDCVYERKKD